MLLHPFRPDGILAWEFVFASSDRAVRSALQSLVAFAGIGEGGTVREARFLPKLAEVDGEAVFRTAVREGLLLREGESQPSNLLRGSTRTTRASPGMSSRRVLPLTLEKANSSSD
jgi:hypothetical protein